MKLVIHGSPVGKGRPRHGNGRTWTPRETVLAEQEIRRAWEDAGSPRLEGPLSVVVTLVVVRPASHFKRDGSLSAEGARHLWPDNRKPDVDNALKLALDALTTRAWSDDVRIVQAFVHRRWGEHPLTVIRARSLSGVSPSLAPSEAQGSTTGPDSGYDGYMARQHDGAFDGRMGGQ